MTIQEKVAKLIDVKSIVTLALTFVFCILAFKGHLPTEFLTIYTTVISFYFGVQYAKAGQTTTGKGDTNEQENTL